MANGIHFQTVEVEASLVDKSHQKFDRKTQIYVADCCWLAAEINATLGFASVHNNTQNVLTVQIYLTINSVLKVSPFFVSHC
jgi:hypothetical protein